VGPRSIHRSSPISRAWRSTWVSSSWSMHCADGRPRRFVAERDQADYVTVGVPPQDQSTKGKHMNERIRLNGIEKTIRKKNRTRRVLRSRGTQNRVTGSEMAFAISVLVVRRFRRLQCLVTISSNVRTSRFAVSCQFISRLKTKRSTKSFLLRRANPPCGSVVAFGSARGTYRRCGGGFMPAAVLFRLPPCPRNFCFRSKK
jgi:hypothetical protein